MTVPHHTPSPAGDAPSASPAPAFLPVPLRPRGDGWTSERQRAFIEALADGGSVRAAAASVGMSEQSAHALRRRAGASSFALAWEAALEAATARLTAAAIDRAIHGVAHPVFYKGEIVGERRHYDNRLAMFLIAMQERRRLNRMVLRHNAQHAPLSLYRTGAGGEGAPPSDPPDPDIVLADWDGFMDRLEAGTADTPAPTAPTPAVKEEAWSDNYYEVWEEAYGVWRTSKLPPEGEDADMIGIPRESYSRAPTRAELQEVYDEDHEEMSVGERRSLLAAIAAAPEHHGDAG